MPTKSIRLSDAEAQGLDRLREATGEAEGPLLERVLLRGLQELRLEEGIRAFSAGRGSSEAATLAGLPRAVFLDMLADRGVPLLDGTPTLSTELASVARRLGDERLATVAQGLVEDEG